MQFLGDDIKDITNKVKQNRIIVKEHAILLQENERMIREIDIFKADLLTLKTRLASRENAIKTQEQEINILQRQLLEERTKNQDFSESLQSLTIRAKNESAASTTQIGHL
jgi:predicted RNase H-like nuclease (RuvC/YqgF family)